MEFRQTEPITLNISMAETWLKPGKMQQTWMKHDETMEEVDVFFQISSMFLGLLQWNFSEHPLDRRGL